MGRKQVAIRAKGLFGNKTVAFQMCDVGTQAHRRFGRNELSVTLYKKDILIELSYNAYPTTQKHNCVQYPKSPLLTL